MYANNFFQDDTPFAFKTHGTNISISQEWCLPLPIAAPYSTVSYEFCTENGDINFSIVFISLDGDEEIWEVGKLGTEISDFVLSFIFRGCSNRTICNTNILPTGSKEFNTVGMIGGLPYMGTWYSGVSNSRQAMYTERCNRTHNNEPSHG